MRARTLFTTAATSYGINCLLGTSVATRLLDTSGYRWLHHAFYITTVTLGGIALVAGALGAAPRGSGRQAAALLAPAAVPMALIPYLGSRGVRHIIVALTAAPFFLASTVRAWR